MLPLVHRREHFSRPELLFPAWTLTKGIKTATCEVWSHVLGFELRALVGSELVQSQVCRSEDELIRIQSDWRAAFGAKGLEGELKRRNHAFGLVVLACLGWSIGPVPTLNTTDVRFFSVGFVISLWIAIDTRRALRFADWVGRPAPSDRRVQIMKLIAAFVAASIGVLLVGNVFRH